MTSSTLKICLGFLTALSLLLIGYVAYGWLLSKAKENLSEIFAENRISTKEISLSFFPGLLSLEKPQLLSGNPLWTEVNARAERVQISFSPLELLFKKISINTIRIEAPNVVVTEGDGHPPSSMEEDSTPSSWEVSAGPTEIQDGEFVYTKYHLSKKASIHVHEIQASVGGWGNRPDFPSTHAEARGLLENSGHFVLFIDDPIFSKRIELEVSLEMKKQNLADLNPFFEPSEGIKLKGFLLEGHSSASIHERKQTAHVEVKYENLDVHFQKTSERSAIAAFFTNLAKAVKLRATDLKERKSEQRRGVRLERKIHESIVSFIIRGMRDGALGIAMGK